MLTDDGPPDAETSALLSLIATCSLEDVDNIQGRRKGKDKGGPLTDEELAFELYAEEARALQILMQDMALARSIEQALIDDTTLLEGYARIEELERGDREIARAIAKGRSPPTRTATPVPTIAHPGTTAPSTIAAVPIKSDISSSIRPTIAVASSSSKKLPSTSRVRMESCVICRDDIAGPAIHAPCGDAYDVECLVDLFRAATVDESLFPPACCRQPFDLATVKVYLTKDLAALVDRKAVEFGTKDRVYCHRPTCSAFLGAATTYNTRLSCLECWADTCGHCKKAAHPSFVQCTSAEDAEVVALAAQSGWKRCPGCGHLVELTVGCYHMTCRCRHQFCYLCAATWKTCQCTQWDENRLLDAAQERVDRQQRVQGGRVRGFAAIDGLAVDYRQVVAREAERLRENHDCAHRWRYVTGAGCCEGCGNYLRIFLYHCNHCQARTCARCRRNRWLW